VRKEERKGDKQREEKEIKRDLHKYEKVERKKE
jgi:hypothetical protein